MKKDKITEIKVGVTVIIGIVILLWILGWAKNFSFNSDEIKLQIQFQNVAGLTVGDGVYLQGIKSGYVENVFHKGNKVVVEAKLNSKLDLRKDAKFSIMMLDLMGGKKIEIVPGLSEQKLDYSQLQKGEFLGDISTSMAVLGSVQNDLVEVIFEVKEALVTFNEIMSNSDFTTELKESVKNLNNLIIKTDKVISENNETFSKLLKNGNKFIVESNKFVNENKKDVKLSLEQINTLLNNSNKLVKQLSDFVTEVKGENNNLGKLLYDKDIINDLTQSLKELKDLSKKINEQINNKGLKVDANVF